MEARIAVKEAFVVVGLRIQTRPMAPEIPQLWHAFVPRIDEIQSVAEPMVSYGVMDNFDPQQQRLDYMAGLSVTNLSEVPRGMVSWQIPGNTYAVFEAPISKISEAFGYIFGVWLPRGEYQQASGPHFERYGENFNPADPESSLEIYIPIEKLPS